MRKGGRRHRLNRTPLIGITCGTSALDPAAKNPQDRINRAYSAAVLQAGGAPVIVPVIESDGAGEALLERLDGLLVSGGYDVAPCLYGEETLNDTVEIDGPRDRSELPFLKAAVERNIPMLCICRGIQSLNVALGGTLFQDLPAQRPSEVQHRQAEARDAATHSIHIESGSLLAKTVGMGEMGVNSFHHQALKDVAPGLVVTARAEDGVVEAVERPGSKFLLAVQFHPEETATWCERSRSLFRALCEAAQPGARCRRALKER
jgi:putative glutamine amidotransferase